MSHKESPLEHSKHPVNAPGLSEPLGPWNLQHHPTDHLSIWIQLFKNMSLWSKADGGCVAPTIAPSPHSALVGIGSRPRRSLEHPRIPPLFLSYHFFPIYTYTLSDHTFICIFTKEFVDDGEDAEEERQKKPSKAPRQKRKKQVGLAELAYWAVG